MGVSVPQVITETKASGAQVIDGSLNFFQESNPYLEFTPGSDGNRSTWTISFWAKVDPNSTSTYNPFTLATSDNYAWEYEGLHYAGNNLYYIDYISQGSGSNILWRTNAKFRDTGWYHFMAVKVNNSTFKLYANGEELTDLSSNTNNGNQSSYWNKSGQKMFLGGAKFSSEFSSHSPGMSQFYFIDGQALAPTDFAFTDPLTNTWRPKKYTGTFTGTNTCYLPFDGNSPIGQDKSGNGNHWKPVNFGGSVEIDKATGARPILNTTQGGTQAGVGVFGSKEGFYETVSSSSGGGNPYIFDTRGTQPTLSFIRGATYVFDYSSATSHPLRFATAADAAGSTQYTTGTSVSGNVISFTVPHNAPDTLYYYCTNHSGMGNSISVTTDNTKADQYASNCTLALPLVANKEDLSNQINSGSTTKVMTTIGNAAASSDTSNFYSGSFEFDGSGDGISTPDNTDFEFGDGDFTIECWAKQDTTNAWRVFVAKYSGSGNGGFYMGHNNSGKPVFINSDGTTFTATNFTADEQTWYHMAVCREGSATNLYINGVCEATGNTSNDSGSTSKLTIGCEDDGSSSPMDGYIQDVRIYKGVAKYSGTTVGTQYFVVPSTNPDILPDTPSGVSGRSKLAKITEGAVTGFETNSDYLAHGGSSDFEFTGDHTIEMFIYHNTLSGDSVPYATGGSGSPDQLYISTAGSLYYAYGQTGNINSPSGSIVVGKWQHIAVSKQGTNLRMFVDGKLVVSSSNHSSTIGSSSAPAYIGVRGDGNHPVEGFISNLRIVKGTALYTSNFTPPKEPLTAVTNTKLLCCQSPTSCGSATVTPSSSVGNTSRVWSAEATSGGTIHGTYNSVKSLFTSSYGTSFVERFMSGSSSGDSIFYKPSSDITYSSSFSLYLRNGDTANSTFSYSLDGGSSYTNLTTTSGNGSWVDISGSGTITAANGIYVKHVTTAGTNAVDWRGIKVDNSALVDPITPYGDAVETTFNPFNTDINTVRGQETGYATWNPLKMGTGDVSMSEGNLFWRTTSNGPDRCTYSTIGMDSGKFYWENEIVEATATAVGIANVFANQDGGPALAHNWMYYSATGQLYLDGTASSYGAAYNTNGTIIGVAFDRDNLTLEFFKNGVSQGKLTDISGLIDSETYFAMCGDSGGASQSQVRVNFGQKPFKYAPPEGYQSLNLATVRPDKVISRPDQYFGVSLWSGNGTSQSITGLQHKPDFVWLKKRAGGTARSHQLFDSVRGVHETLHSDGNSAEDTNSNRLTAFNRDGFTVGGDDGSNGSGGTFVGWTWKAGGSKNTFNVDDVGYASASNVNMSVGALNSVAFDQSATWSNSLTASNGFISGSYDATKAFNGSTSGNHSGTNSGGTLTFSPNLTIPANSIIEVYSGSAESALMDITVNGVANNSTPGGKFVKVNYDGSTTLTSLTVYRTGGGNSADLRGIRINGKLLVDSGVTVNAPSIAPTGCSVGTKQGFSIIRYQANSTAGASIPHGLSQAPNFVIVKALETAGSANSDWTVFHSTLGGTKAMYLNQSGGSGSTGSWNDTDPDAHVITLGTAHVSNLSPNHYIAYAWHDVPGLQKFGSYVATGQADGPFVECGFRPAIVMVKRDGSGHWVIMDTTRDIDNPMEDRIKIDTNEAESNTPAWDALSNGFKLRSTYGFSNSGTDTYIYAAWAEAPAMNLFGAQSNAR